MMFNDILCILMLVSLVALFMSGYPIAWVLTGVAVLFTGVGYLSDIFVGTDTGLGFTTLGLGAERLFTIMSNWVLIAVPLFIFMGIMLDKSDLAAKMLRSMQKLFGRMRGGLAITVVVIGIILAASTGIIGASVVMLGAISLPVLEKQGYKTTLSLGTIASAGTLGILIPPSIMLVLMADILSISVADLFMAAILPGLILGVLYILYLLIHGRLFPADMPLPAKEEAFTKHDMILLVKSVLAPFTLILLVLGSIFMGIATPTEASGVGAFGATVIAALNKNLNVETFKNVTIATFETVSYIFTIFIGATIFAFVFRELGGDEFVESLLLGLPFGPYGIILVVLFIIFLLGFILDWLEITLIVLPLMTPAIAALNFHFAGSADALTNPIVIWFVILVAIVLQTSFLTPPVGFALFYLKSVTRKGISLTHIAKGVVPFVVIQLVALGLVLFFPTLATWLPSVAYT